MNNAVLYQCKYLFLGCFFAFLVPLLKAQNGSWTWVAGSSSSQTIPLNFGVQGIASSSNYPGDGYAIPEWVDLQGNLWVLGACDNNGNGNAALWKYDLTTGLWTWMKGPQAAFSAGVYGVQGIPSAANYPGGRFFDAASWVDSNGNLWLFGGCGSDINGLSGDLNDLWKYDPLTNEWTWMNGPNIVNQPASYGTLQVASPTNLPEGRCEIGSRWSDENDQFWMYGGLNTFGIPSSIVSDAMWMYSVSTNQWTWMSGQPGGLVNPNFGTIRVPSSSNTPGSRITFSSWKDKDGNFWLFGGGDITTIGPWYADMWKYDPVTNIWTWMAGSQQPLFNTTFTQQCALGNEIPEAALENRACWTDDCGRFWMFGGSATIGELNTMQVFDPNTLQFSWVGGSILPNQSGSFGTQGIASPLNSPPSLNGGAGFKGPDGDFWLFGGMGSNTLWRYRIDQSCPAISTSSFTTLPSTQGCAPLTIQFNPLDTLTAINNYSWNFGESSNQSDTSNLVSPLWTYNQPGDYTATLIINGNCGLDTSSIAISVLGNDVNSILPINVFSPNGDGVNDEFTLGEFSEEEFSLQIFNRWGTRVFESTNPTVKWDGRVNQSNAQDGIYFWVISFKDCSGKLTSKKGFVHLFIS